MVERPVLTPVFLSASIPDPKRDPRYFSTGDTIAIRDAVIALIGTVLPRTKLVFGGHPAITPLAKWVADHFQDFDRVRMFQSKFFRDKYIKEIEVFRYEEVEAEGNRESSLLAMRRKMLRSEKFSAAFFVGGMDGVEREYELVQKLEYPVPIFPVYTTGAAARDIWEVEMRRASDLRAPIRSVRHAELEQLRAETSYVALFTRLLENLTKG